MSEEPIEIKELSAKDIDELFKAFDKAADELNQMMQLFNTAVVIAIEPLRSVIERIKHDWDEQDSSEQVDVDALINRINEEAE